MPKLFIEAKPDYYDKKYPNTWDYQADYYKCLEFLRNYLYELGKMIENSKYTKRNTYLLHKHYARVSIMITNLLNGLRLSEGVEALYRACVERDYVLIEQGYLVSVRVRKKRIRTEYRPALIPIFINLDFCRPDVIFLWNNGEVKKTTLSKWVLCFFGHNTHTLRYAFISHMALDKGHDVVTICRFVRHSTIEHTYNYITRIKAEQAVFDNIYEDISSVL